MLFRSGQNWERAAYIKARPVAGDLWAGEEFLKELAPFVWRKYFDFAAIADVHSIKRQIHAHKGHGKIAVIGHNSGQASDQPRSCRNTPRDSSIM